MNYTLEHADAWVIVRYPETGQIAFRYNEGDLAGALEALEGVVKAFGLALSNPVETEPAPDALTQTGSL